MFFESQLGDVGKNYYEQFIAPRVLKADYRNTWSV